MKMTNNAPLYWYVFYNDQLLLQKKAGGYAIPFMNEAPVTVTRSLPVEMQDGTMAMAAFTDVPLVETDVYLPMGLRSSYDHLDRYFYDQAGKAYEIVYWDQHSRFCPVCGTPTELKGPGLWERDVSGSIARYSCFDPERRGNPVSTCT